MITTATEIQPVSNSLDEIVDWQNAVGVLAGIANIMQRSQTFNKIAGEFLTRSHKDTERM